MEKPINLICVDDHSIYRLGLRNFINYESKHTINLIAEATNGAEFLDQLTHLSPDVVLLDIVLPDISGIELARIVKQTKPEIKVLMLSSVDDVRIIEQLIALGVNGFISKSSPVEELLNAFISVTNGLDYFGKDIAKLLHGVTVSMDDLQISSFTAKEEQILKMSANGLLAKEIGDELGISSKTVAVHKCNIFKKMGINNTVELVRYALKNGIIEL